MTEIPPEEMRRRMALYDAEMDTIIALQGVCLQCVFPTEEGQPPSFTYSVGLSAHDPPHPEFISFGQPFDLVRAYLNILCDNVLQGGAKYEPGRIPEFLEDQNGGKFDGYLLEVDDTTEFLTMANMRYRMDGGPIRAYQFVWPDEEGLFPWEEGYSVNPNAQPLLGQPPQ